MIRSARTQRVRSLKGLANISWLTASQLEKLAGAMALARYEKRSTIFSDKSFSKSAHILLSGVARVTCDNRQGRRKMAIMLSPGLIPAFPTPVAGITYNFRCEAVTNCAVGTIELNSFMKICLGIGSEAFNLMAASLLGRWDRVHLRCANLVGCTLEERLALVLLDLSESFGITDHRGGMLLTVPVRHSDLADLVGATRSRVTEHMLQFSKRHLISRQDQGLVVNRERLKGFLIEAHHEGLSGELR